MAKVNAATLIRRITRMRVLASSSWQHQGGTGKLRSKWQVHYSSGVTESELPAARAVHAWRCRARPPSASDESPVRTGGAVRQEDEKAVGFVRVPVHLGEVDLARLFVLNGRIVTGSRYARYGQLDTAPLTGDPREGAVREFASRLLRAQHGSLPSGVVIDVGLLQEADTGREPWAVVEANMAWFAHSAGWRPWPDHPVADADLYPGEPRSLAA